MCVNLFTNECWEADSVKNAMHTPFKAAFAAALAFPLGFLELDFGPVPI